MNPVGKACTMYVDYVETMLSMLKLMYCRNYSYCTIGATVLENTVVRKGKKHSYNKISYNSLGSPTQADQNSRRSQYLHHGLLHWSNLIY